MRLVWLLLCLLLCGSCHRATKLRIGFIPKGTSHLFWQTVHAGAIKAAQEFGFDLEWNSPALEIDASRQIAIMDSMINRRLTGIAIAPVDRKALVGVIERAHREGIPVAVFDSDVDTSKRISYVATNNKEGGRMAAKRLAAVVGGTGTVGIVGFMPGSASTMEREEGFIAEIREHYPRITVLPVQFGMADRAKALAVTENMLTANDALAGLFADNESSSAGAVQALKARNAKSVKMVAFDASEQLIHELEAGWIDSIVVQNPFRMGYETGKALGLQLHGKEPARFVDSGATLVQRTDLGNPQVQELLFPDIRRYLQEGGQ